MFVFAEGDDLRELSPRLPTMSLEEILDAVDSIVPVDMEDAAEAMYELLIESNLTGRNRVGRDALGKGFRVGEEIIWKDFEGKYDPISKFIRDKVNFHKFNFEMLSGPAKRQAWTIAWVENQANLDRAKDVIEEFVREFGHIPNDPDLLVQTEWGKKLLKALKTEQHTFEAWHLETVFKTNAATAYVDGKMTEYQAQAREGWIESLTYLSVRAANTRPGHAALHGTTKRIDDFFWTIYLPPIDYNCNCDVRANYLGSTRRITPGIPIDPETGIPVVPGPGFGRSGFKIGDFAFTRNR